MHPEKGIKYVGDSRIPAEGRMKNIPKDYSQYPGKMEPLLPNFMLKEWMIGSIFLIGILVLTVAHPSPLERIADPTDTAYTPLPDWYFLFLYQLLKYSYASGTYTVMGALVIPGLAFGALLLAPFLDRGLERRPSKRPVATGMMLLALASTIYLTWESVVTHDWEAQKMQGKIVADVEVDTNSEGYKLLEANTCLSCHGTDLKGGAGPALIDTGLTPEEIAKIAVDGRGAMPPNIFQGTDEELEKLADYLANLKPE